VSPSKGLEALCRDLSVACSFLGMTSKSRMILSTIGGPIHCDALFYSTFLQGTILQFVENLLLEISNSGSPPAQPGVYLGEIRFDVSSPFR
jgi:hypothetical protein